MAKALLSRWWPSLKRAMPVVLDVNGVMLLSGSAMLWNLSAGLAVAGIGSFVINWRIHGDG